MPLKAVIAVANTKTKHYEFVYAVPQAPTYSYNDMKNVQINLVHSRAAASRFDAKTLNGLELDLPFDLVKINQQGEAIITHLAFNLPKGFDSIQIHAFHDNHNSQRIIQQCFPIAKQLSPKLPKKTPKPKLPSLGDIAKSTVFAPKKVVPLSPWAPKKVTTTSPNKNNDIFPVFDVSQGINPVAHEIPILRHKPETKKPLIQSIHPVTPKQLDLD